MLVLSLACLVLLGQATGLAVNLAGRILTPQERIDKIARYLEEIRLSTNREYGPEDKIEVSGIVRTWELVHRFPADHGCCWTTYGTRSQRLP